jgi:hypothetical protein
MTDRSTTPRGFNVYAEFTDTYGSDIRVQQSSNAERDAVWIFANHPDGHEIPPRFKQRLASAGFTRPVDIAELASVLEPSPHLDVEQAKRVRDALDAFIREHEAGEVGNG